MKYKLGLKPVKQKLKLHLASYINKSLLPSPPAKIDWTEALQTDWGMMANDSVGDCFWAMAGHAFMTWSANAQAKQDSFSDEDILTAYSGCTGYDRSDPNSDVGTDAAEGFKYLQEVGIAGHKFGPTVGVNFLDIQELKIACDLFGGLCICVAFPAQWEMAQIWDLTSSKIVGGHAIWGAAYGIDAVEGVTIVTWGGQRLLTWRAIPKFCSQVAVTVPTEWIADNNLSPSGFDLEHLLDDEAALAA